MVCKALREKGHQAILVDVFCGVEVPQVDDELFMEDYDVDQAAAYMRSFDGQLPEIQAGRREFFGPNVLELCQYADLVFLALHGANGEDGKVQAAFDLVRHPVYWHRLSEQRDRDGQDADEAVLPGPSCTNAGGDLH